MTIKQKRHRRFEIQRTRRRLALIGARDDYAEVCRRYWGALSHSERSKLHMGKRKGDRK